MDSYRILHCELDQVAWNQFSDNSGDLYHSPDWVKLHLSDSDSEGLLFVYEEGGNYWCYPFIKRPVPSLYHVDFFDLECPYGYGGPFSNIRTLDFIKNANVAFYQWCKEANILAEFTTLNPFLNNEILLGPLAVVMNDRETVSLDLSRLDIADNYSAKGRYMIRQSHKFDIKIKELDVSESYEDFVRLYLGAMRTLKAEKFYFFSDDYFESLQKMVKRQGYLVSATINGQYVAASMFIRHGDHMHYHLSANNHEIKAPGATNAMIDYAARLGVRDGLVRLHLGGGRSSEIDDSLLKFKKSMGNEIHQFKISKSIHHRKKYEEVIQKWENLALPKSYYSDVKLLRYRNIK